MGKDSCILVRATLDSARQTSTQFNGDLLDTISSDEIKQLNAFTNTSPQLALEAAKQSDERRAHGAAKGRLDGVPIVVKDNFCVQRTTTTCASRMLKDFAAPYTATAVDRLLKEGAVLLGKANMDEFAMGALGSDTGGSVRLPASYCGVVGYKPTYGLVSRHGLVLYGSSLDCPSIITSVVEDAAIMLDTISGEDPLDTMTTEGDHTPFTYAEYKDQVTGLRVGVPKEYYTEEVSDEVLRVWRETIDTLEGLGAEVCSVSLPNTRHALPTYYILAPAEASSNLARFDGVQYGHRADADRDSSFVHTRGEGFGDVVKARVILGTFCLSRDVFKHDYYDHAMRVRTKIRDDFDRVFSAHTQGENQAKNSADTSVDRSQVDLLLTAVACGTSPTVNEWNNLSGADHNANDVFTVPASLAGLPAISIPIGEDGRTGMPIGMQLIGPAHSDARVLSVSHALMEVARRER
ncbi:hypothetical protein SARC_05041 [Sphaeroforma arctica JP610]|uniref:Glutamyl-tRNA(Gln) amidotransferase subunit A, mitochondrial n=1 Tax=Sphaeroforma arctica JP610 TaxID=667725 RepID=A0A0L0G0P8_9EUKA|nr:hypothetical protein SARC_05041 [Sphaeroforma arctica JP610]KNC82682.1 hypothetical protein SARC_05041 [Sphaeroforma arctica JP610]|eukprot:XP_014156584.1 hypothetical protein SARC_05041 [Sphaeroforma arctica JP610]